ncbi:MAG: hypothetical protein ACTHN5_19025 [Phycisphaerae bacterium]
MSKAHGLWIAVGGGSLAGDIENSIDSREQFTYTVVTRDVHPKYAEIAIVSLYGTSATYLGICQAGRKTVTGQRTILVTNLIRLGNLKSQEIRESLPDRFRHSFNPPESGVYRPTPRVWEEVLDVVAIKRPEIKSKLIDLKMIVATSKPNAGRLDGGLEIFERDAVACAIQTWGGTGMRKRILRTAVPSRSRAVAPFLSQLSGTRLREDPQINHDHVSFPGMEVAERHMVGSIVMGNWLSGEQLTILNCNRQPLEQTLGVDLIYYNHRFDSFVLVQYKRMDAGDGRTPVYRPDNDASHDKELQKMSDVDEMLKGLPPEERAELASYRLSERPFYLKLCESKVKAALDAGMVSGMYIPLDLWRRLLKSPNIVGNQGGRAISWQNCSRKFNNGEFTNLLRHGWIGSATGQSKTLSSIIERVLSSGRMLVLAATSGGSSRLDLRRDSLGKFATRDDPDGVI